jgi:hypothetical protein
VHGANPKLSNSKLLSKYADGTKSQPKYLSKGDPKSPVFKATQLPHANHQLAAIQLQILGA